MQSRMLIGPKPVVTRRRRNNRAGNFNQQAVIDVIDTELPQIEDLSPVASERGLPMPRHNENSGSGILQHPNSSSETEREEQTGRGRKRKLARRHTDYQTQELEAYFRQCPNPDSQQRRELSRGIGLEPLQVKFWFQNKRTQTKWQQDREESDRLQKENEKLRAENFYYRNALSIAYCPTCHGHGRVRETSVTRDQLRLENSRLREQIKRVSRIAAMVEYQRGSSLSTTLDIRSVGGSAGQRDFTTTGSLQIGSAARSGVRRDFTTASSLEIGPVAGTEGQRDFTTTSSLRLGLVTMNEGQRDFATSGPLQIGSVARNGRQRDYTTVDSLQRGGRELATSGFHQLGFVVGNGGRRDFAKTGQPQIGLVAENEGQQHFATPTSLQVGLVAEGGGRAEFAGDTDAAIKDMHMSIIGPNREKVPLIIELVKTAMDELLKEAELGDCFLMLKTNRTHYVLNNQCFEQLHRETGTMTNGWKVESSREWGIVMMSHLNLVEVFMDLGKWRAIFANIVPMAMVLEQVRDGTQGTYDGTIQLIVAEYHVLTPIVPTRKSVFARYCKKVAEGTWAVVDVSVDSILPAGSAATTTCRHRPSGCIIHEISDNFSKVICVEHVKVDDQVVHSLARHFLNSSLAYGARRWVAELDRQSERLARSEATINPRNGLNELELENPEARRNLLQLFERMVLRFCGGISSSAAYGWKHVSGDGVDKARIMTKEAVNEPGMRCGLLVAASISLWLPASPKVVFDYLSDENTRREWDILSRGGVVEEMARIHFVRDAGNVLSILRIKGNASLGNMLILQESRTEPTSSYVIYSPVDAGFMNEIFAGEPEKVAIIPCGFTILPCLPPPHVAGTSNQAACTGTLLTAGFQIYQNARGLAEAIEAMTNITEITKRVVKNYFISKTT